MLDGNLEMLRPVYYLILIFLLFNLLYLAFLKEKIRQSLYIAFNSVFIVIIGLVLFFQQNIIVDELNLSGDSLIFTLLIISIVVTIISLFLSFKRSSRN